ncbi:dTMP kinase [Candidatus Bandiella numerosa]|uniref:dTMP kinase n=1 Tax=Candidatus Bandiella numerosa TaxID=2570586 RepID=UPI001F008496|nr:dTMP kinase [Candidatus Bandiella numerosa]
MKFITFEGCDFCGKSTQIQLLKEHFEINNKKVFLTREPGGTELAEKIRELILSFKEITDPLTECLLISAARKDHVDNLIKKKLQQGYYVLSDRFYDSSICYQGYYKGLDTNILKTIKELIIGKFEPDLTFLIDIPEDEIEKRKGTKRVNNNIYDTKSKDFYKIIRSGYLKIAHHDNDRIFVIDGNKKIADVNAQIIKIIKEKIL